MTSAGTPIYDLFTGLECPPVPKKDVRFFMRPNYTRGCDKDGHTPPFLKDIDLMSALAMWGRGRIIRQKHLKKPANVEGVPAVAIPYVR